MAPSISHFLTITIKLSCYSSTKLVLFAFFISGSSSFSVIHVNLDFKIESKERIGFVIVVFFISKSPGGYAIYCRNARVLEMHTGLHKRVDVPKDDFLRTKISCVHILPNFLTHGAPRRARELRYKYSVTKAY